MMLAFILNNQYARMATAVSIAVAICYPVAYRSGVSSERLSQAKIQLAQEQKYRAELAAQQKHSNEVVAKFNELKTSSVIETTKLKEIIKHDKNLIDRINHIDFSFVRHVSKPTVPAKSSTSGTVNAETKAIPNPRAVPASRVANYIVELNEHDNNCVIQLNSLIDTQ